VKLIILSSRKYWFENFLKGNNSSSLRINDSQILPNKEQEILLNNHFGTARFIYNKCLGLKIEKYTESQETISRFELQVLMKELKNTDEFFWLNQVNSQSIQYAIKNLDDSYTNFFRTKKGFPKFKKKGLKDSFTCPQFVSIIDDEIHIPKFKEGIKIVVDRKPKGTIKSATFSKMSSGKIFVSVLCETNEKIPLKKEIKKETAVGIDLGLKHFLIFSDGRKIENPHFYKNSLKKIKSLSRSLSRKEKGSNHYIKNNKFSSLISYADCRWSGIVPEETVYYKAGFEFTSNTEKISDIFLTGTSSFLTTGFMGSSALMIPALSFFTTVFCSILSLYELSAFWLFFIS